eukprot:s1128_g21.t1
MEQVAAPVIELVTKGKMDEVEAFLQEDANKPMVTKAFYHWIIHACQTKLNKPEAARWFATRMEKSGYKANVVTFNCMIGSCIKNGALEQARAWWDVMAVSGIKPNRITYNILISSCAKTRDAAAAEKWMLRMIEQGIKPCTVSFTAVISAFAKDLKSAERNPGRLDRALLRREEAGIQGGARFEVADSVVFNSMINACAKAGDIESADHWLGRMLQERSCRLEGACGLEGAYGLAGLKPDDKTYNSLMHACGRNGNPERAELWYAQMTSQGFRPDRITFSTIINSCAKAGEIEKALNPELCKLIIDMLIHFDHEMENHGFAPNLMCYNCLLQACADWLFSMIQDGCEPDAVTYALLTDQNAEKLLQGFGRHSGRTLAKFMEARWYLLTAGDAYVFLQAYLKLMEHFKITPPDHVMRDIAGYVMLKQASMLETAKVSPPPAAKKLDIALDVSHDIKQPVLSGEMSIIYSLLILSTQSPTPDDQISILTKDDPSSFHLSPELSIFPQFMYHLRRSNFLQTFNASPDETAYYRMLILRENTMNSLVMIQPALLQYSFDEGPPQPVLLDATSLKPNVILLLDAFFHVVIWRGEMIQAWYDAGYQDKEEYANFKALLTAPAEDAKHILADRFPVPKFIQTNAGGSQARFLTSKVNPSQTHNSGPGWGGGSDSSVVITDDVSLKVFMEHLIRLAVQS